MEPCASVGNWSSFAVAWSRLRWKRVGSDAMSTAVSADISVRSALKLTHAGRVQADSVFEYNPDKGHWNALGDAGAVATFKENSPTRRFTRMLLQCTNSALPSQGAERWPAPCPRLWQWRPQEAAGGRRRPQKVRPRSFPPRTCTLYCRHEHRCYSAERDGKLHSNN